MRSLKLWIFICSCCWLLLLLPSLSQANTYYYWTTGTEKFPTPEASCASRLGGGAVSTFAQYETDTTYQCFQVWASGFEESRGSTGRQESSINHFPSINSCQDLADDAGSWSGEISINGACNQGCSVQGDGVGVYNSDTGLWNFSSISYTGDAMACGGYNASLPYEDITETEEKICKDPNGNMIGKVGFNVPCPELKVCFSGTTPTSISPLGMPCPDGGTGYPADANGDPIAPTETTVNEAGESLTSADLPAGVSTPAGTKSIGKTTSSTTSTTTAADGTSVTTTTTSETYTFYDGAGNPISSETIQNTTENETTPAETEGNVDAPVDGEDLDFAGSGFGKCDVPFVCNGDFWKCYQVEIQHKNYCRNELPVGTETDPAASLAALIGDSDFPDDGDVMAALSTEVDVFDQFFSGVGSALTNPSGRAGSCPSPINLNVLGTSQQFDWGFICDMASEAKPLVLLATMILCFMMFASSIFGITFRGSK